MKYYRLSEFSILSLCFCYLIIAIAWIYLQPDHFTAGLISGQSGMLLMLIWHLKLENKTTANSQDKPVFTTDIQNHNQKIDRHWIRACKSKDPHTRIKSVYKKFYYSKNPSTWYQCYLLISVINRNMPPLSTQTLINEIQHEIQIDTLYLKNNQQPIENYILKILINHVRFMKASEIKNLKPLSIT